MIGRECLRILPASVLRAMLSAQENINLRGASGVVGKTWGRLELAIEKFVKVYIKGWEGAGG